MLDIATFEKYVAAGKNAVPETTLTPTYSGGRVGVSNKTVSPNPKVMGTVLDSTGRGEMRSTKNGFV
jgi:hypothetical protein